MIQQTIALNSIVAAYAVVFGGIFIFVWLMTSRQKRLEKKLQALREEIRDRRG